MKPWTFAGPSEAGDLRWITVLEFAPGCDMHVLVDEDGLIFRAAEYNHHGLLVDNWQATA